MSIFADGGNAESKRRAQLQLQMPARLLMGAGIKTDDRKFGKRVRDATDKIGVVRDYPLANHYTLRFRRAAAKIFSDVRAAMPKQKNDNLQREIDAYIALYGVSLASDIADALKTKVAAAVATGAAGGATETETAERITELTGGAIAARRAIRIARTEVHAMMLHYSSRIAEKELGARKKKWNAATHQERTRPSHRAASGQQRKIGEAFIVGGAAMRYPGDPRGPARERINCRCVLTWEFPPE